MKKMRALLQYVLVLATIGSASLLFSPHAYANSIDDIYKSESARLQSKGITVPWGNAQQFQDQIVGPCYQAVKAKTGSWASRTTQEDCARVAMSCLETVTTEHRCEEPSTMADAAQGKNAVQRSECGGGLGTENGCFVKWNQEARQDRWNKSYDQLITNLCSEAAKAGTITTDQTQSCHGDGEAAYNTCYDRVAKTDPRVPEDKLRECFNNEFKSKNGIDASNPSTPGNSTPSDPANGGAGNTSKKSVCAIQKIGWLICPVTEFVANLADKVYAGVAGFMEVRAFSSTQDAFDTSSPLMKSWIQMRDIANILFVVAFLIIIYSQITGAGVSNYGIKRMLPRLIIGAILVNASFYICALAIDLSNILGYALKEMLTSMKPKDILIDADKINDFAMWSNATTAILAGGAIAGGAIAIGAAAGGLLATALGALIPLLLASIFAVIVAFLVLLARQAIIIILIVISPLAFVAYLLPNTESLFDKWRKIFTTMLVMFPLVGLLFGGSQLAASILQQAGVSMAGSSDAQGKILGIFLWIGGIGVLFIPLFMVPFFVKVSGGVIGRFAGIVNNRSKGLLDRSGKLTEDKLENMRMRHTAKVLKAPESKSIRGYGARRAQRNTNYKEMLKSRQEASQGGFDLADAQSRIYSDETSLNKAATSATNIAKNRNLTDALARGADAGAPLGGVAAELAEDALKAQRTKAMAEAVKDVELSADFAPGALEEMGKALIDATKQGDSVGARAYQNMLLKSGSKGLMEYRKRMTEMTTAGGSDYVPNSNPAMDALRHNMIENNGQVKAAANDLMKQAIDGSSMAEAYNNPDTWKMSDAELVAQKGASLNLALGARAISKEQAARISSNQELAKHLDPDVRDRIRRLGSS